MSDDRTHVLVEFVAHDRSAFSAIFNDKQVNVLFEKGKSKKDDIENAPRKFKKDFDLTKFGTELPRYDW